MSDRPNIRDSLTGHDTGDGVRLFGRPIVGSPAVGAWLIMVVGILVGYEFYEPHVVEAISLNPLQFDRTSSYAINYEVYHTAADATIAGVDMYDVHPERLPESYVYLYPPITVLAFLPFTFVDAWTGYLVMTVVTLLASLAAAWAVVSYVEDHGGRLGWLDCALIAGFFVGSIYSAGTVLFGNVNLWLAAFVSIGLLALARDHQVLAGAAFALAALFKVFPALLGLWLLRRRAYRAIAAAVTVGGGGLVAGVILFGIGPTRTYFESVVAGRTESGTFVGGYPVEALNYVTVQRPVSWFVWLVHPDAGIGWLYVTTAVALLAILAFFYVDLSRPMDRHAAILASVVAAVVAFPALRWYLVLCYLPILVLAYRWSGPGYRTFVAGGVLFSISIHPRVVYAALSSPDSIVLVETVDAVVTQLDIGTLLTFAFTPLVPLAVIGSPQLWGIVLMLVACGVSKVAAGTDPVTAFRAWRDGPHSSTNADSKSSLGTQNDSDMRRQ